MNTKTKLYCIISLVSSAIAVVFLLFPFSHNYQMHMFFAQGHDFLADFLNNLCSLSIAQGFNPYHTWCIAASEQIYPPFAYAVMKPFASFMPDSATSLGSCFASRQAMAVGLVGLVFMTVATVAALVMARNKYKTPHTVCLAVALSGIVPFSLERGNLICLALLGIMTFLYYCDIERPSAKLLAAAGLALAVALKVTPVLFGVIWLNRKDFRHLLMAGAMTVVISILPLLASDHTIAENIMQLLANVSEHEQQYAMYSISINPACVLNAAVNKLSVPFASLVAPVKYFAAACGILGLAIAARGCVAKWKVLFLLAASQVLVSSAPQQYVVLFFLPSLFAFLSDVQVSNAGERITFLAVFLIITTPLQLFIIQGYSMNFAFVSAAVLLGTLFVEIETIVLHCNRLTDKP